MNDVRVGFARREITPDLGSPALYGISCRVEEIWDPLYVTAVVLQDRSETAVVIATDLAETLGETHIELRNSVAQAIGIAPEHVMLNTSHSHSAPYLHVEVQRLLDPYGVVAVDYEYVDRVRQQMVAAVGEAVENAAPVSLHFGRAEVDRVAGNRRVRDATGRTISRIGQAPAEHRALPEGLIDPVVSVVRFDDADQRPIGAVVNYACHPT